MRRGERFSSSSSSLCVFNNETEGEEEEEGVGDTRRESLPSPTSYYCTSSLSSDSLFLFPHSSTSQCNIGLEEKDVMYDKQLCVCMSLSVCSAADG